MYRTNTQLPKVEPDFEPFITRHHIYGLIFLFVVFGLLIFIIYDWQYGKQAALIDPNQQIGGGNGQICLQMIQAARNEKTGDIREFATPCDVPQGWTKIGPVIYDNTDDWRLYNNDRFDLTFKYPAEFKLVRDNTLAEADHYSHILELVNTEAKERPVLRLEINRENSQIFYPDKVYVLVENQDQGFAILDQHSPSTPESVDGKVLIRPELYNSINGNQYQFLFEYDEGGQNYDALFKKILTTFDTVK